MNKLQTYSAEFKEAKTFGIPRIISLKVENLTYDGEWVEGDIIFKYDLGGEQEKTQHFKTKINVNQDFDLGPVKAKFHVWLDGAKLWFGVKLCVSVITEICTDEFKTSVDVPQ